MDKISKSTKGYNLPDDLIKKLNQEAHNEDRSDSAQLARILRDRYEGKPEGSKRDD